MKDIFSKTYSSTPVKLGLLMGLLGVCLCYKAIYDVNEGRFLDLCLNAGTELLGIAITVAFVQVIFDSIEKRTNIKSLTWDILIDTDYAVWVWQGGERIFKKHELLYLINKISTADPCPATTQNVLLALGNKAANLKLTKGELIKGEKRLKEGLTFLSELATIRDNGTGVLKNNEVMASAIKRATICFFDVLEIDIKEKVEETYNGDSTEDAQVWRHVGQDMGPTRSGEYVDIQSHVKVGRGVN